MDGDEYDGDEYDGNRYNVDYEQQERGARGRSTMTGRGSENISKRCKSNTKEFIANDSGTKYGDGYLYPENVLFEAIWQYSSGAKAPKLPLGIKKKGMLVVIKSE